MDFSLFLWDTSDSGTTPVNNPQNIANDVIINEMENDLSNSSEYPPYIDPYEYRILMATLYLILGCDFVISTGDGPIGQWYNALTSIQRMAWLELHLAVTDHMDMLNSFCQSQRVSSQNVSTPSHRALIPPRSQVASNMPDLLAPPNATAAPSDVRLRSGYARRGR